MFSYYHNAIFGDAMSRGKYEKHSVKELEEMIHELEERKNELELEFGKIVSRHANESRKNAVMRMHYRELFKDNQALSIRLAGLAAANKSLSILLGQNPDIEKRDEEILERYVLRSNNEISG